MILPIRARLDVYKRQEQYCSDQYLIDEMNLHLETPLEDIDELIELVRKQNPTALGILDTYIRNLAIGLSNIIFFVNCEMIILNSHLIQSLPYLMPEIMKDIVLPKMCIRDRASAFKEREISEISCWRLSPPPFLLPLIS